MILAVFLSATFTFTATATGVEKGTAIEFFFAGPNTDRAYETLFTLDESVNSFCKRIDAAIPRGIHVDATTCRLWPTGCQVRFDPPLERFVCTDIPGRKDLPVPIYTGGLRNKMDKPVACETMPASVFSAYSLPQSPIVFSEPFEQGAVYGCFTAASSLEKGMKVTFTVIIDEDTMPRKLELTAEKESLPQLVNTLRTEAASGEVDAKVILSDALTVKEAAAVAQALSVIDSPRIKINGCQGLFYRAFLPLEKWRDRKERLHQPFELSLRPDGSDELLYIEEDWNVEGNDPKLSPHRISFQQAQRFTETDTCFIYAPATQTLSRVFYSIKQLKSAHIVNWYVFSKD